ncbi:MAG TPA: GAF domain-containing protein, partial [Anaerolineae bacterium]|nr:GAF domain-containing protein [Anaerolineae bacterium]
MSADHPKKPGHSLSPAELQEAYAQLQAEYDALREDYGRLQQQSLNSQAEFPQNKLGNKSEQRQKVYTRTLQELGVVLTSSLNLDDVLDTIGKQILSLMAVSSCTIMLLEPPDELIWRAMIGLPEEIRRIGRQRIGEGLSGWVAAHRQLLQIEHAYNDPRLSNADLRRRHGYYTFLGVPMEVKGELVGVFEIFTMEPRRFDEEEEALLAAFARQAAVAVENARLFEEVNKRVQELEQLYQAAHAMSASL